ncbi:MAG: rhomboid family intramembrane serine protease [Lutibacter sp.]|nr:rhomboid family intramembrane serine protease [Lutibacter sp.]
MPVDTTLLLLILSNVLISIKGFNDLYFFERYKFQISAIQRGEHIRLFSAAFLHADYLHLLLNMYVLYIFAPIVIAAIGPFLFVGLYLGSLCAGNFLTLAYHRKEAHYSAVGASGAVAGVLYAAIILFPDMTLMVFPLPIPLPGYIVGIGYLLYTVYGLKKRLGAIGHAAHLGGAIGGYVLIILLEPSVLGQQLFTVLLLGIPILLLLLFRKYLT